jgi:hypothetical protein
MDRHAFLSAVHRNLRPRSYLEIGINDGRGLARSRTRTIGVDPSFKLTAEVACELKLVRQTSDDFFTRPDALSWFPEGVVDLTFVDGMHLFEFALRDFINAERCSSPAGVIILDDVLPRSVAEAARNRHTVAWTGDVYKMTAALERCRPDLTVVPVDTRPTGMLLVVGLDPASTVLADRYEELLADLATEDPQQVPEDVLLRRTAADPDLVAGSPIWAELAEARDTGAAAPSLSELRSLRGTARYLRVPPPDQPWPRPAPPVAGRVRRAVGRRVRRLLPG